MHYFKGIGLFIRYNLFMKYEEFKKILKKNNLTVKDFAKKSETSYNTCGTWSKSDRKVPTWVNSWLNLYEKNKQLKELKQDDCEEYKKALAKALQDNLK